MNDLMARWLDGEGPDDEPDWHDQEDGWEDAYRPATASEAAEFLEELRASEERP